MADSDDEGDTMDTRISEQQMAKARKAIDFLSSLDLPCSSKNVSGSSGSTRPHCRFTVPSGSQADSHPSATSLTFAHSRMSRESTNCKFSKYKIALFMAILCHDYRTASNFRR